MKTEEKLLWILDGFAHGNWDEEENRKRISITGGELLTDKDAISMTSNSVLFFHDGFYSELRHTESGGIEYAWGKSLDSMDDVIRCEAESWLELSQPREEKR